MSRWLYAGFWLYERSGVYAPALGPLLWSMAMASTLLHNVVLSVALSVCVLYYNVSISLALRNRVRERDRQLQGLLAYFDAPLLRASNALPLADRIAQALEETLRCNERLRSESHFSGIALAQLATTADGTARDQRQRLEMIAAAAEEIAQTGEHIRALGDQASAAFTTVHQNCTEGHGDMLALRTMMQSVLASVVSTTEAVEDLRTRAEAIGGFVQTIEGVAKQTQLLALNASIEAARAGEHGRGFSVVADEVRQLATSTENATRDITEIIGKIGIAVDQVQGRVDEHRVLAEHGAARSAALGASLQALTVLSRDNVDDLTGLQRALDEHAQASHSLSEQLQEVNTSVIEHAGQSERLRALTGYLTQLTQVRKAAPTPTNSGSAIHSRDPIHSLDKVAVQS